MQSLTSRRRGALALVLAASASGALVACNFIVDAGSYSVGNGSGDASTEDTGTIGADSSTVDTGSVDTGAIGDSGTPADTGSPAADSGTPAEGSTVCGEGLPSSSAFAKLVTSCALAASCSPGGPIANISYCISNDFLHSATALACLYGITDCNGFEACLGSKVPTSAQCPSMATAPFCTDAGVGINCGDGLYTYPVALDCNVLGGTCGVYSTDAGGGADCFQFNGCTGDPDTYDCKNNELYYCVNGKAYGQSCGTNQTCIDDPTNGSNCYFNAASCNYQGEDTYTCNGNSVDLCTEVNGNGVNLPYNCSSAGLTCNANADQMGNAGCLAPGCTSDDYNNCTESCSGSSATVCVGGAPYTFDCKGIGATGTFTTCAMLTDSNDNPYVACQ